MNDSRIPDYGAAIASDCANETSRRITEGRRIEQELEQALFDACDEKNAASLYEVCAYDDEIDDLNHILYLASDEYQYEGVDSEAFKDACMALVEKVRERAMKESGNA